MLELAKRFHIASDVQFCAETKRFSSADLAYLSKTVFRSGSIAACPEQAQHIHIFEARDAVSELEYVCATIRKQLMQDDTLHCNDIAILTNDLEVYRPIVHHAFSRYELPFYLDTAVSAPSVFRIPVDPAGIGTAAAFADGLPVAICKGRLFRM